MIELAGFIGGVINAVALIARDILCGRLIHWTRSKMKAKRLINVL